MAHLHSFVPIARRFAGCVAAMLALASAPAALAQLPNFDNFTGGFGGGLGGNDQHVAIEAGFTAGAKDQPAMLFVTATVADGYHLYAIDQEKLPDGGGPQATELRLVDGQPAKIVGPWKSIEAPEAHVDNLVWPGLELREHAGKVTWYAPIEFAEGTDAKGLVLEGVLEGQACNPSVCVPVEVAFTAELGEGVPIPDQPVEELETSDKSLWVVAAYGVLGGLILNLMPCVLPVIGLKILSFAEQGGRSRAKILGLNLSYSAGLLSVFMVLATLAAAVNFGWGEIYTYTWFKVAMTALVFSMALSFLGVWEIPIPGFAASSKATELSAREGPVGAFCMGIITTLLAVPCSGPYLGPVLGYTIGQPPAMTYIIFASIGLGMALPYLAIGAFPGLIRWLPKPGAWMETFKHLLGFALLATVVYLFSTLHGDYFLATLALLFSIWFGCWWIGRVPSYAEPSIRRRGWLVGTLMAAGIGLGSFALLMPNKSALPWQPYTPQALAVARAAGKTVLVDFTANWCPTCKTNLKFAINREDVKELVQANDVVTLLADWTDKNDMIKQALLDLNSRSIPLLAIYPADPEREVMVLPDLLTQGEVLEALAEAGPSMPPQETAAADRRAAVFETSLDAPAAPDFGAALPPASVNR